MLTFAANDIMMTFIVVYEHQYPSGYLSSVTAQSVTSSARSKDDSDILQALSTSTSVKPESDDNAPLKAAVKPGEQDAALRPTYQMARY